MKNFSLFLVIVGLMLHNDVAPMFRIKGSRETIQVIKRSFFIPHHFLCLRGRKMIQVISPVRAKQDQSTKESTSSSANNDSSTLLAGWLVAHQVPYADCRTRGIDDRSNESDGPSVLSDDYSSSNSDSDLKIPLHKNSNNT